MKNTFIAFICLLCTISMAQHTQNKISPYTAMMLADMEHYTCNPHRQSKPAYPLKQRDGLWYANAFLILHSANDVDVLQQYRVHINTCVGPYLTVTLPITEIKHLALCEQVDYIEIGEPVKPLLDSARYKTMVDMVQSGYSLPQAYNGKDVVVGIIDIGFDYTHPQFLDPTGSYLRIKRVWNQDDENGTHPAGYNYGSELTDSTAMYRALYSHNNQSHGSHVAGIAAGGGYRDSTPYKGMAPLSDIVMVATDMSTAGIYDGICYIADYARSVGKPCVINMSLGSHVGPHDGCSTFDIYCSTLLRDFFPQGVILVGSAGNEGGDSLHLNVNTASTIRSFLYYDTYGYKGSGYIDIWGDTNAQYSVAVGIYNTRTHSVIDSSFSINPRIQSTGTIALTDNDASAPDTLKISVSTEIFPLNNKPRVLLYINNSKQDDSVNLTYVQITTYNNAPVHAWFNSGTFTNYDISGYVDGNTDCTCGECGGTGKSMISVGAYTSRRNWTTLNQGSFYYPSATLNDIAPFSSHGPTADGRNKPDVAAPGQTLASSVNSYHPSYNANSSYTVADVISNNRTYYYAVMQGTSMAAPSMTGIMALWLQAYPQLSVAQAKAIIQATSIQDAFYTRADLWGAGKVNAMAGIQYILSHIPPKVKYSDTTICQGDTILVEAPAGYKHYIWTTGDTTQSIHVSTAGSYAVKLTSTDDYTGPWSDTMNVSIDTIPATPTISRNGFTLSSDNATGNQWYNNGNIISGATGTTYTVSMPGIYGLTVKNAHGCTSGMDTINIDTIEFIPLKPAISPAGDIYICEGDSVTLSAPDGYAAYTWNRGHTTPHITVSDSGYYTVKVTNNIGYSSVWSDSVHLIYATPATPVITAHNNVLTSSAASGNQWYYNNRIIAGATLAQYTADTIGCYGVIVTGQEGCQSDMGIIMLDSTAFTPEIPHIIPAGDTTICPYTYITLNAPEGYKAYLWSTGDTTPHITVNSIGEYRVKVMNEYNYYSTWSEATHLYHYPLPERPIITRNGLDLTSSAASGNQWYYEHTIIAGATLQNYTVSQSGWYELTVSNEYGCISDSAETYVDIYEGINTTDYNGRILLYPNPSQGEAVISCPFNTMNTQIQVYDITGQYISVPAPARSENSIKVHFNDLSAGVYIIKLLTENGTYSLRMIISR